MIDLHPIGSSVTHDLPLEGAKLALSLVTPNVSTVVDVTTLRASTTLAISLTCWSYQFVLHEKP
jgi:hypothetical protein